jgi:hypothetical protein
MGADVDDFILYAMLHAVSSSLCDGPGTKSKMTMILPMVQNLKVGNVELGLKSESIGQRPVSE